MTEEDIKEINKLSRMINGGAIAERFDVAVEQISRIAVNDRISEPIHKTINPMLDEMIRQLNSMKNNVMACMIGKDDTPMKVAQHKDCDDGRICPKCGKVMILCEDEKTYYQIWECDGCGHKEDD